LRSSSNTPQAATLPSYPAVLALTPARCHLTTLLLRLPDLPAGINRQLGLSDELFALADTALLTVLAQVAFMPLLVLAARICPPVSSKCSALSCAMWCGGAVVWWCGVLWCAVM
jgi:hypothetical protein